MVPPIQAVNAAAAIEVDTPTSAIHLSIAHFNIISHQRMSDESREKRELTLLQQLKLSLLVYTTFQ